MFAATRSRCGGLALLVALLCACTAAPSWGAISAQYDPRPLDPTGAALAGARAGDGVQNAGDVNADGLDDVLVAAPSAPISGAITGRVFMYSGATGQQLWEAAAPFPQAQAEGASTQFGDGIARLGDIGRCTFGGSSCTFNAALDGAAELLVSAPGTDTGGAGGPDQGVVYVLDGASGRILKDVRLSAAGRPFFGSAGFGKAVSSLSGQSPCAGFGGIGDCYEPPGSGVAVGDIDGGGKPDFVIGAPDYTEAGDGEYPGCPVGDPCSGVGRIYVIRGEQISGSSQTPLSVDGDNVSVIQFPGQAGAGEPPRFGSALTPVGDLGRCAEGDPTGVPTCVRPVVPLTSIPDGRPDFLASAPGADVGSTADAGAAFVVDPVGVAAMLEIDSPTPQSGAGFGTFAQSFLAPGRLGDDTTPDILLGAPAQDGGVAHLVNGDVLGASRVIRTFTDPAAVGGGQFGASLAGLGDVSGDGIGEAAIGAAGGGRVGSVHVVTACARDIVQTIPDPDPQTGGGFGAAVAPLGDLNGDNMLDLAVGMPGFDAGAGANRGRAYVLTSSGPPVPTPDGCAGGAGDGGGGGNGGGGSAGGPQADPPGNGEVIVARVLRRLVLKATPKRVRKYSVFRLSGRLSASANRSVCQSGQKVALQRRKTSGGRFQTFELAYTRRSGAFNLRAVAERTFVYRARVTQTPRCMGAVSKAAKVTLVKRRGSR